LPKDVNERCERLYFISCDTKEKDDASGQ